MNKIWQLQDAKSKFSQLVNSAVNHGPQMVTKRGQNAVVILSIKDYKKLRRPKDKLLDFFQKAPKIDLNIKRRKDRDRSVDL